MTLLECLTLMNPTAEFYSPNFQIRYDRINEVMGSEHCVCYSSTILYLIGAMLGCDWSKRPSFDQISHDFQHLMKRDYGIRVNKNIGDAYEIKKMSLSKKVHSYD